MTSTFPRSRRLLLTGAALSALCATASGEERLMGFTPESTSRQRAVEERFLAIPSPERMREWHRHFTAEPHPAGSEQNNLYAEHIAQQWREQGLEDVTLHRYDVLNTAPREVLLEMLEPVPYRAALREAAYEVDPDTNHPGVGPGYLGLSASGEITAPIVYAHSGNPEDYALLRERGIDVKGKIALVRYSNPYSYRGFKALTAEREGAAAIVIYSDPAEDGYAQGPVYPDGPWGPETHIQRGAITYDFIVPGDPLTPGWASVPGARQIAKEDAVSLPRIVALPLSWHDAKPLLENMGGPPAPKEWQGALPIEYRLGGADNQVHIKVDMDNSVGPNYVVEARVRGAERPDEWIILGNHHDAWVFGGVDPSSGTASMMELSRALGALLKEGIRPRRSLVLCSWDGEEVGLTGSTEWGEQFADELKGHALAYINVDSSASGPDFQGDAVASLAPWLVETTRALEAPTGESLLDAWLASRQRALVEAAEAAGQPAPAAVTDATLAETRIGSGSDHTVFLNHLGIPTLGLTFNGPYGVYHSVYDSFRWMNQFGDPGYRYHTLMTRLWGVLALRLANADLLPHDFAFYGRTLDGFLDELVEGKDVSLLALGPLREAVARFEKAGARLKAAVSAELTAGGPAAELSRRVNQGMLGVERNWLHAEGIPNRPWFKHLLYAARYTYAHLELPGLTEAVEAADWPRANVQARLLQSALEKNTSLLEGLAAELEQAAKTEQATPAVP